MTTAMTATLGIIAMTAVIAAITEIWRRNQVLKFERSRGAWPSGKIMRDAVIILFCKKNDGKGGEILSFGEASVAGDIQRSHLRP